MFGHFARVETQWDIAAWMVYQLLAAWVKKPPMPSELLNWRGPHRQRLDRAAARRRAARAARGDCDKDETENED